MLNKIKSRFIIKRVFENVRHKMKLKILKYNKKLLNALNIKSEDFDIYNILKNFNNKYNTINDSSYINDIDTDELFLNCLELGNEIFLFLNKIKFKYLKCLYLGNNNISDIKLLEKIKYEKLENLFLASNNISDINVLEKVNYKELFELPYFSKYSI